MSRLELKGNAWNLNIALVIWVIRGGPTSRLPRTGGASEMGTFSLGRLVPLVVATDKVYKLWVSTMFGGCLMDQETGEEPGSWTDAEARGIEGCYQCVMPWGPERMETQARGFGFLEWLLQVTTGQTYLQLLSLWKQKPKQNFCHQVQSSVISTDTVLVLSDIRIHMRELIS